MNKVITITITIIIFIICSNSIWGQSNSSEPTNNTIVRLTIINDKGEILIRETAYGWMTPAVYHNKRQNINEMIDDMAKKYGVEITKPNLAGIFNYKYEFKSTADIRLLYVAKQIGGKLIAEIENENLHWIAKDEGIVKLTATVPSLGEMTKQILDYPQIIWGGSFTLSKDEMKNMKSEMTENFYPLIGNK